MLSTQLHVYSESSPAKPDTSSCSKTFGGFQWFAVENLPVNKSDALQRLLLANREKNTFKGRREVDALLPWTNQAHDLLSSLKQG